MSKLPTLLVKGSLKDYFNDGKEDYESYIPMEYIKKLTKKMLSGVGIENRVMIVKAMTASGKSTALPAIIYVEFIHKMKIKDKGLICTQPKVLTAINNINDIVPFYPQLVVGETIGWSTQYNKLRPLRYGFLSATIGTLAQQLISMTDQELMDRYKFIMIDEVHERSIQIDMTLYYLKKFLERNGDNPNCPMVYLMSATFIPEPFLEFFNIPKRNFVYVVGRSFPIDTHWMKETPQNIFKGAASRTKEIIEKDKDKENRDILIFMVGKGEIEDTTKELQALNASLPPKDVFSICAIDSVAVNSMNDDYQRAINIPIEYQKVKVGDKILKPARRVIISSNVAETGLTLPNLGHVIDAGYNRQTMVFPNYNLTGLLTLPATLASVQQRKGRAGRRFPGDFYPLYDKDTYEALQPLKFPDIIIDDALPLILAIIYERVANVGHFVYEDMTLVDIPSHDTYMQTLERLYLLGIIDIKGNKVVEGNHLEYFNNMCGMMSIESSRMIIAGYFWNVSILDLVSIAAYLQIKSPRKPFKIDKMLEYLNIYEECEISRDQFLHGVLLFEFIDKTLKGGGKDSMKYCYEKMEECAIPSDFAIEFLTKREDILLKMISLKYDITYGEHLFSSYKDVKNIKHCIYDGYRCNSLTNIDGKYYTHFGNLEVKLPKNVKSKNLLYSELKLKSDRKTNLYKITISHVHPTEIPIDNDYFI